MPNTAAAAKKRRLAKRRCGECDAPADHMRWWGRVQIPICVPCDRKLKQDASLVKDLQETLQSRVQQVLELSQQNDNLQRRNKAVWTMLRKAQIRAESAEAELEEFEFTGEGVSARSVDFDELSKLDDAQLRNWVKVGRTLVGQGDLKDAAPRAARWVIENMGSAHA